MTKEPILILAALSAAINGIQTAVISMPTWAHTVLAIASSALLVLGRQFVTPI